MSEAEKELVSKMLRAVLQSNKDGVVLDRLQFEYNSLTGERIPFKKLGYPTLETYLRSIPSVVTMENVRGMVVCFAMVCKETEQIAKFVARQKNSKKRTGVQVNCQMRMKYSSTYALIGKPKATLRPPCFSNPSAMCVQRPLPSIVQNKGGFQWVGKSDPRPTKAALFPPGSGTYRVPAAQMQDHFANRSDKQLTITTQVQKELNTQLSKNYNENQNASLSSREKNKMLPEPSGIVAVQNNIKELLKKYTYGIWLSKLPRFYKETFKHDLDEKSISQLEKWHHVCVFEKVISGDHADVLLYPSGSLQNQQKRPTHVDNNYNQERVPATFSSSKQEPFDKQSISTSTDSPNSTLKEKIVGLLKKYSNGLWVDALPKVFEATYKERFPEDVLQNLDWLLDICTVDHISLNPQKAIIYPKSKTNGDVCTTKKELELASKEVMECGIDSQNETALDPPPLVIPNEPSQSVLVVELNTTNEVVIRYVGEDYSLAQECVEDEMKEYYDQNPAATLIRTANVGQLVAVRAEESVWMRAKVLSVEGEKIQVFYVDYGFSEMISKDQMRKLDKQFYCLAFQAAKCRLAGLEAFSSDPVLLKSIEVKACGKILAAEILERSDIPIMVLYDTSGEEDVNINAICIKELYDKTLYLQVKVDALYTNVRVTNVCSDGTFFCQVPSVGLAKLRDSLQQIENYFRCKPVTSEVFVSLPFVGKICLFFCKGKYARVEITCVHSSRAIDIQSLDSATINTVKVSDLREIPPQFLRELITIPPQVLKCCLADLPSSISMFTPDAVLWLRDTVLNCAGCSIKVVKVGGSGGMVHVYLFTPKDILHPDCSINRQITNDNLWKHQMDVFLSVNQAGSGQIRGKGDCKHTPELPNVGLRQELANPIKKPVLENSFVLNASDLPPLLPLPKPGEQMDVYVSVACHPGHFVIQTWRELHKLEILMEDMVLYYSTAEERPIPLEYNTPYAAKVENKWYRALLRGILTNGLVSIYQLDYGKHELVSYRKIQPLNEKFRQLPFQAVTAQLAGVKCEQWSEEASIVFRNHVEKKPLVAMVQSVFESGEPWDRRVVAYIVDTSLPETDLWIHSLMSEFLEGLSKS
ncbi:tudor domain-containing protein 7 isoform X2 [Ambystoma mexicanum]|uniref:tudor domain-containing protein 7 isoform X2 n=1 Tax=Ambystoma mexicanum TaxID=8296 RepID=UPI0037E7A411